MKLSKSTKTILIFTLIIVLAAAAYAYFFGKTDPVTNTFTISYGDYNAEGSLVGYIDESDQKNPERENIWETDADGYYEYDYDGDGVPDAAESLQPNQSLYKSPSITSLAGYDAWAFMEVQVPVIFASLDEDGDGVLQSREQDLYYDIVTLDDISSNWQLLYSSTGDKENSSMYIYAYKSVLIAGGCTDDLFRSITVQDFMSIGDDQALGDKELKVTGQIIQTYGYDTYEDAALALGYTINVNSDTENDTDSDSDSDTDIESA